VNPTIFNRFERKYLITTSEKDELLSYFKTYLIDDPFSKNGEHYTIHNLYFDTPDYGVIRNSIQKPKYKDKLRLRSYKLPLEPFDIVFLEIKKKFEGRINKRRLDLTYQEALDYIYHQKTPILTTYEQKQIFAEIDYFINIHKAKPGAYIKYDRVALMSETDDLRVTFDHDILFRNKNVSFESTSGLPILASKDLWLMEVKSDRNFPLWLVSKLSKHTLYSQSFSKYGKAYQQYLTGGNTDDFILYHY
jgi:hypothetical protein